MNIKPIYLDYCTQQEVPLFFQPAWLDAADMPWDVVLAEKQGYKAFWIYHQYKKLGVQFIRNAHLTPYTGLLLTDPATPPSLTLDLIADLLLQLPGSDVLEIDMPILGLTQPAINGITITNRHTNLLDILDIQLAYDNLKPALKRQIRKAERILQVYEQDDLETFYRLHTLSFEKQGRNPGIPFEAMKAYWTCCKQHNAGRLFFARDEAQQVHAALWLAYDTNQAYYLAGGTDHHFYGSGAMSLLMWHAIRESHHMGKKQFDFEGSMRAQVDRFFKNFSPQEVTYFHLERIQSLLYSLAGRIRNR